MTHLEATAKRIDRNFEMDEQLEHSILYCEINVDVFGNDKDSRVEYPLPTYKAIEITKRIRNKRVVHINDAIRNVDECVNRLVELIKRGDLDELLKVQITDDTYNLFYKFGEVVHQIKYREVE